MESFIDTKSSALRVLTGGEASAIEATPLSVTETIHFDRDDVKIDDLKFRNIF